MARLKEHPRYANFDWPDWEFREYPMMVYPGAPDPRKPVYWPDGRLRGQLKFKGVTVHDDDELAAVLEGAAVLNEAGDGILTEAERRQALYRELDNFGVAYDKRWATPRLESLLDEATKPEPAEVL